MGSVYGFWLKTNHSRPYHVTYLSAMSQNEFIGVLGEEIRKVLVSQIISCGVYAVIADTTHDVSHADQISLDIRYVDNNFEVNQRLMKISQING